MSDVLQRCERAGDMVSALCQPRGSDGAREWIMRIPADPRHDPDLVIGAALADIPMLYAALTAAEQRAARAEEDARKYALVVEGQRKTIKEAAQRVNDLETAVRQAAATLAEIACWIRPDSSVKRIARVYALVSETAAALRAALPPAVEPPGEGAGT